MVSMKNFLPAALAAASPVAAIIGGDPVEFSQYPYLVSLYNTSNIVHPRPTCTGVLIDEKTVLTAASCVHDMEATNGRVALGSLGHSPPSNKTHHIWAWDFFTYPGSYDYKTNQHDLAIISFTGDHNVTTFPKLAQRGQFFHERVSRVKMVGFRLGISQKVAEDAQALQKLDLHAISRAQCRTEMWGRDSIHNDKFCARGCGKGGHGTSYAADTGAPVFYKGLLVGVTSAGGKQGGDCYPRTFTRMSQHEGFITDYYRKLANHRRPVGSHGSPVGSHGSQKMRMVVDEDVDEGRHVTREDEDEDSGLVWHS